MVSREDYGKNNEVTRPLWELLDIRLLNKPQDLSGLLNHLRGWEKYGIPFSYSDLVRVAIQYNVKVPVAYRR